MPSEDLSPHGYNGAKTGELSLSPAELTPPSTGMRYLWDGKIKGLGVRLMAPSLRNPEGIKTVVLRYRVRDTREQRIYTIKRLDDGDLATARARTDTLRFIREQARELKKQIAVGADPHSDGQKAREAEAIAAGKPLADVLDDWIARYVRKNALRSGDELADIIERLVKPTLGQHDVYQKERLHLDFVELLDTIEDDRGPVMADRVLSTVRGALNWYAARDPKFNMLHMRGLARTKPLERARRRVLSDDEVRDLWTALDAVAEMAKARKYLAPYPRFVRALLLSGQRRDEVSRMTYDEIDGDEWLIPAVRYKTKLPHLLPLTPELLALIGERDKLGAYVFSNNRGKSAFSTFSKAKKILDGEIAKLRAARGAPEMERWTHHDLRRTARSLMSRAGVDKDHAERVLGHVIPGIRRIYDRHEFAAEKLAALEALDAMVRTILNPPPANVAQLHERRRKR